MKSLSLLCAAFALVASSLGAQRASGFEFTIKNIMRGPELYGREPQNVRWSADGKWIYFNWLEPGSSCLSWKAPKRNSLIEVGVTTRVQLARSVRSNTLLLALLPSALPSGFESCV